MNSGRALTMPQPCPCGGEYLVYRPDGAPPGELRLMHKKPACEAHGKMSADEYLKWVGSPFAGVLKDAPTPTTKPNRRQRRANAVAARRAKGTPTTLDGITREYKDAGGGSK